MAGTGEAPLDMLIVGAGISGIGIAAHLCAALPGKRFAIVEQRDRIGGTWDLFRYPGVRSDSDMHTLGYAFAPWADRRSIAPGEAIRDYLEDVADERGISSRIRFGLRALSADWDSDARLWTLAVEDRSGTRSTISASFLFLGAGYYDYDDPYDAQIPGIGTFGGLTVHPQFWPEGIDYSGKRVVVIGSGATAVTLVPAMAERAASVTMLQRTPGWFMRVPAVDRFAAVLHRLLPRRMAHALVRAKNVAVQDWFFRRSRNSPQEVSEFLERKLRDELGPAWRAADYTPPYGPWEQRMCFVPDGDMFAAVSSGRAEVVTGQIAQVEPDGVRLEDGRLLAGDIIVTATGLKLAGFGKITVTLDGVAADLPSRFYYRNCMLSNVPNFASLFGYLNASWTLRVDIVGEWLVRLLSQMDAWGADVVTPCLADDHGLVEDDPVALFSSGYLQRGRHLIPKSAATAPWRISMDYLADRREMREAPIDDGVLRFDRRLRPATAA